MRENTLPHHLIQILLSGLLLLAVVGCSANHIRPSDGGEPAQRPVSEYVKEGTEYWVDEYDPWEGFNRPMYLFNAKFDEYVFIPVVKGYRFIFPGFLRKGISNIFSNFGELENFVNSVLQLKPVAAGKTLGRFGVNSTVGVAGFFDVATDWGIYEQDEDFGQTLGRYGVGPGPYLVLPIAGPSTLRDATGSAVDLVTYNAIVEQIGAVETWREDPAREYGTTAAKAISRRDEIEFRYYQTGSPFEYELVRKLYLAKRKLDVTK